jgi:predicted RNase H-like HicB family nuclease
MAHRHRFRIGVGVVAVGLAAALTLIAAGGGASLAQGDIIYVDADATGGANNGSSWADAYTTLQPALAAAASGDEIWVAAGTYKPTDGADRTASFAMKNGVAIYGGFDPSVGDLDWEDRDSEANATILSGDIGNPGDDSDNSYHVFYHPEGTNLDGTAILDGFTITGANADGDAWPHNSGGGMFNEGSSPTLTDCTFSGNSAGLGGGMANFYASSPALTNCTFSGNSATRGGGMYNETSSPVLTGCTFTAGNSGTGGGMANFYASSPTLTNCTFSGNSAGLGGGMANFYASSPALTNCTFSGNSAIHAGGMYNNGSSPTLTNCTFSGNSADGHGGGMWNNGSSPTLTECTFSDNLAGDGYIADYGWGGGMYNEGSSPTLTDCTFSGNTAWVDGGGMYNQDSSPTLTNCIFNNNSAGYYGSGGGMYNEGSSPTLTSCIFNNNSTGDYGSGAGMHNEGSSPTLTNCTFAGNWADWGGGMRNDYSSPTLTNCTFAGNEALYLGGGIYNGYSSPTLLTNCILWADSPDEVENAGSTPSVTYSDVQGGYTGTGNINADPLFVDPGSADLHLGPGSPCIDAGDNEAPNLPAYDFEGDLRIVDGDRDGVAIVDMGVDEALLRVYLPVVVRNW